MIKFYLSTVLIYFIVYIASGILIKKQFIKARNKLKKAMNDSSKNWGYIRTTAHYLLLSFIPVIRLFTLIAKYTLVMNTDEVIKRVKEKSDE